VVETAGRATRYAGRHGRRAVVRRVAAARLAHRLAPGAKVQLGCGPNHFEGWVNVDLDRAVRPDVSVDLRGGFPAPARTLSRVYSEHVLEHFSLDDGTQILRDCAAAMQPGGVLRVAMPDLAALVDLYHGDWRAQEWLRAPQYARIDSPARMLNFALREWGHRYIYDFAELRLRLHEAGFVDVVACEWGQSSHDDLRDRETRPDSTLIAEATVA
jgi:predicted SAM-dependent methyltransferase